MEKGLHVGKEREEIDRRNVQKSRLGLSPPLPLPAPATTCLIQNSLWDYSMEWGWQKSPSPCWRTLGLVSNFRTKCDLIESFSESSSCVPWISPDVWVKLLTCFSKSDSPSQIHFTQLLLPMTTILLKEHCIEGPPDLCEKCLESICWEKRKGIFSPSLIFPFVYPTSIFIKCLPHWLTLESIT